MNPTKLDEFQNDNLLARKFTSQQYMKRLSNQQMTYQFITADTSQAQEMLSQVQVVIPNSYITSCPNDYFTFTMQFLVQSQPNGMTFQSGDKVVVVQYKNAIYALNIQDGSSVAQQVSEKAVLRSFVDAINKVDFNTFASDNGNNTPDYGCFVLQSQMSQTLTTTINPVQQEVVNTSSQTVNVLDATTTATTTSTVASQNIAGNLVLAGASINIYYAKIMNLPYTSLGFLRQSVLSHKNTDKKGGEFQQTNPLLFRQQQDPTITQEYANSHWYTHYFNDVPIALYQQTLSGDNFKFSYQVMIPMQKIFALFQMPFLPLEKLANPLYLQFMINTAYLQNAFSVWGKSAVTPGQNPTKIQYINYDLISYYSVGCFMLFCDDPVLSRKLQEDLDGGQPIILPQTYKWIESFTCSTSEQQPHNTHVGFNCLTNVQLNLYFTNNDAYFRGYSSLKDICQEYITTDPQKDTFEWYEKNYSFLEPQCCFNSKQLMIGGKYLQSIPFYLSINNRGQQNSDACPTTQNMDYFNSLNIQYQQFTDQDVHDISPEELNFSGISVQRDNNSYIITQLANYNTSNYQSRLQPVTGNVLNNQQTYNLEIIYSAKQILQINKDHQLVPVLQEYMM